MMMITSPSVPLGYEWLDEIQALHDSRASLGQYVSLAREVLQHHRPNQQLQEVNMASPTIARESDNDCASVTLSSARRFSSDTDLCRSELKKSSSIVRGFSASHISSSFRSQANPTLNQASTRLKHSPPKKKPRVFILGGSFKNGDDSSFEECMAARSPQDDTTESGMVKSDSRPLSLREEMASANDQVPLGTMWHPRSPCSSNKGATQRNDEGPERTFEEDDEFEWEDLVIESGKSNCEDQGQLFQRMDSQPNLVSRQSMLTMMMEQPGKMEENAFRSSPVLQGSCLMSPKCVSTSASPPEYDEENSSMGGSNLPRSNATIVKPSPPSSVADTPHAIRHQMLASELIGSDRRHLLWERQQSNNACLKRRHTANNVEHLQEYPEPRGTHKGTPPVQSGDGPELNSESQEKHRDTSSIDSQTSCLTDYGPWEYHVRGW
ncbi:hypothetical protein N7513_003599 [Penicillium frequentans]|nr:hypothetical protein N7513_003599 [Penicillium glabrum]